MAAQADSRSIIATSNAGRLKRNAIAALDAIRRFVSPAVIAKPGVAARTLIVPVCDDGWSPTFCCGEFVLIDTADALPEEGRFVYRRGSRNSFAIVRLRQHVNRKDGLIIDGPTEPRWMSDGRGGGYWDGVYWRIQYGAQVVRGLDGLPSEAVAPGGRIHFFDGPLPDKFMREEIMGSVVGVLGQPGRPLNWKDAR